MSACNNDVLTVNMYIMMIFFCCICDFIITRLNCAAFKFACNVEQLK